MTIADKKYTEYQIDALREELYRGSGMSGGKERIAFLYATEKDAKKRESFLKDEYGTGGHSGGADSHSVSYDGKGIRISFEDNEDVTFPWSMVEKYTKETVESKDKPYLTSLFNVNKGIIIVPVEDQPFKMFNGNNPVFEKIVTLFPKVREILMNNCKTYTPDRLDGRTQRIMLTDSLTLALVYCRHGKTFRENDDEKFVSAVKRLCEKYPDDRVSVLADFGFYGNELKGYTNFPCDRDRLTKRLFEEAKYENLAVRDIFTGYLMNDAVFSELARKEEMQKDGWTDIPEVLEKELEDIFGEHEC